MIKPKLILVSGLTASGKTLVASSLAKKLNTEIIVGDSLQIYKNYPIAANFPSFKPEDDVKYNLLGQLDVFKERIVATKYKDLVMGEIQRLHELNKIPIVEGGSGFYLNYLLTSSSTLHDDEKWNKATKEAEKIFQQSPLDWNALKRVKRLLEICPHYDNSISTNDFYRLKKAFVYAIASNGERFTTAKPAQDRVLDIFDVRGFFLTLKQEDLKTAVDQRCYQMTMMGVIDEFIDFIIGLDRCLENYADGPVPIGFKEIARLLNELAKLDADEDKLKSKDFHGEFKQVFDIWRIFMAEFQIASRRYAAYQRRYCRSKLKSLLWKEVEKPSRTRNLAPLIDQILEDIMIPQEEFVKRVQSNANQALVQECSDNSTTKRFKPEYDLKFDNVMTQRLINLILPRLTVPVMEKVKTFLEADIGGN